MGKHTNPKNRLINPRIKYLRLGDLEGVHPAVRKERKGIAPEPLIGMRDVKEDAIEDTLAVPRIAVVLMPGQKKFWVWSGIRFYLRLIDLNWSREFPVLSYGLEMPETRIVELAKADLRFASIFSGQSAKSDRAIAQEWEADSANICRQAKSGRRGRSNGLNVFANLRGLKPRPLRADNTLEATDPADKTGAGTDDEEGNEN